VTSTEGRRGRQFERIYKWFVTHDPVYGHELRRFWLPDQLHEEQRGVLIFSPNALP
jgi:hypothetical protein